MSVKAKRLKEMAVKQGHVFILFISVH